jgi:oligopeptide/dipeptide ABC transporter ATP-binding protein
VSGGLLQVRGLQVAYRVAGTDLTALDDVSFDIDEGEILGLVGESGSGKSTVAAAMLRILARNGRITAGSIRFGGRELTTFTPEQMRRVRGGEIAMIFQDPLGSLNPTMTVGHQLLYVAGSHPERTARSHNAIRSRIVELFTEVGIPDPEQRFDDYPHQFSGGMRQRVMIAMALLLRPSLIIADEATSALDVTLQAQILDLFRQVRETHGTSVLLVSHDLGVVAQTCDRVSVMYAGRIVEAAQTRLLFAQPLHPYTRDLIATAPSYDERDHTLRGIPGRVPSLREMPPGCAYADRCVHRVAECDDQPPVVEVGQHLVRCIMYADTASRRGSEYQVRVTQARACAVDIHPTDSTAEPLVALRGVTKHFGVHRTLFERARGVAPTPVRAVDNVDLELRRGEILGLVGESGSGKTTLAMTIMRLTDVTSGEIEFDGIDMRGVDRDRMRRLRTRMQIILQDPVGSLSPRMRVRDLIAEPYAINRIPLPSGRVTELLGLVGLSPELEDKYPYQLSGGQARRVSIARAVALQPDLIVADEPTSGLDVSAAAGVLSLMQELRDRLGITYLLITHDLNVVGQIADRVCVMYLGQIIESGTVAQIFEDPVHPYTQGLLAAVPRPRPHPGDDSPREVVPRGEMPSPRHPPSGCRFHTRCRLATPMCAVDTPELDAVSDGHVVSCHFWMEARQTRPRLSDRSARATPAADSHQP